MEEILCEVCNGEVVVFHKGENKGKFTCKDCGHLLTDERKAELLCAAIQKLSK